MYVRALDSICTLQAGLHLEICMKSRIIKEQLCAAILYYYFEGFEESLQNMRIRVEDYIMVWAQLDWIISHSLSTVTSPTQSNGLSKRRSEMFKIWAELNAALISDWLGPGEVHSEEAEHKYKHLAQSFCWQHLSDCYFWPVVAELWCSLRFKHGAWPVSQVSFELYCLVVSFAYLYL